jgi:hypothetical protein
MQVLHWQWIAVLVIPMFVTILSVSFYHDIGAHSVLLEGVTGGGGGSSSSSSSSIVVVAVAVAVVTVDRGCTIVVCGGRKTTGVWALVSTPLWAPVSTP